MNSIFALFLLTPLREGRPRRTTKWLRFTRFLLTPLREGRLSAPVVAIIAAIDFYSRPCGRGDHPDRAQTMNSIHFYSRPCGRGDEYTPDSFMMTDSYFYSRPCGRGDCLPSCGSANGQKYFYSRPCGRGDHVECGRLRDVRYISTHAPAGGATQGVIGVRRRLVEDFYSRPCGRGDRGRSKSRRKGIDFYSRPCGRGDETIDALGQVKTNFYSRPCGRGDGLCIEDIKATSTFLLTPLREGRRARQLHRAAVRKHFYLRPCGRGDLAALRDAAFYLLISTHAPAGGATAALHVPAAFLTKFLLTPLREGRPSSRTSSPGRPDFYSRPCGRGDLVVLRPVFVYEDFYSRPCGRGDSSQASSSSSILYFYSRPCGRGDIPKVGFNVPLVIISTHAPAGGATGYLYDTAAYDSLFLLTPLREGRPDGQRGQARLSADFYSRPCGRGDRRGFRIASAQFRFLLTPLREGRPCPLRHRCSRFPISTHAPAGGATTMNFADPC